MKPEIQMTEREIKLLEALLQRTLPVGTDVYAFGSRANWTGKDHSDLDLLVDANRPISFREMARFESELEDSPFPFPIDLVDAYSIDESFRQRIDGQKKHIFTVSDLPKGWVAMTLRDFVSLQRGHDLPAESRGIGSIPVIGSFGVTGYHDSARAKGPGVTVGRSGASAGSVFYVQEDYWPHNTCLFVTDFHGNNPRFAYYLLGTLDLPNHAAGSAQPSLNRNHISPLPIVVPERPEQDRIVAVLSALDDKIELNRRMNETLEGMAQAIFKDWFVDFGPVRRKLEGVTDPVAIMGGLTPARAPELAALFPDGFGDDGLPEGWEMRPLRELTTKITKGTTPTAIELASAKVPEDRVNFLRVNAINDSGLVMWDKLETIPASVHFGALKRSILEPEDIAYSIAGTIGRIAFVQNELLPANTNQAVAIIRANPDFVPARYLLLALKQHFFTESLHANVVHAVQANLSLSMISAAQVLYPGKPSIDQLFSTIEPLIRRAEANNRENRTLAETRDYLLPKLMSGEVRVRDAERMVG